MANKRRPKKFKPPYRKYVGGVGYVNSSQIVVNGVIVDKSKHLFLQNNDGDDYEVIEHFQDVSLEHELDTSNNKPESLLKEGTYNSRLPNELYLRIINFVIDMDNSDSYNINKPDIQTKARYVDKKYSLVCKDFYLMMLPRLYGTPNLTSKNFLKFIDILDFDKKLKKNLKKNQESIITYFSLASFVKVLDLSMIIQSGKNSIISKLLRRCSGSLIEFVAPQTSFGKLSLTTLKACTNLEKLNLQLVAEKVDLVELFSGLDRFCKLKSFALPRSSFNCDRLVAMCRETDLTSSNTSIWPPNMEDVTLCGNITNSFISTCVLPANLKALSISYCPLIDDVSIYKILAKCGYTLESIQFGYPLTKLRQDSLDDVFRYCSDSLKELKILVDHISKYFFLDETHVATNLHTLTLDCSGSLGQINKIHPDDLTIAIVENRLPSLKTLYISVKIGWDLKSDDVEDLISVFESQGGSIYLTY